MKTTPQMKTTRDNVLGVPLLKIDKGIPAPVYTFEDRLLATLIALKPVGTTPEDIESFELSLENLPTLKKCMAKFRAKTFLVSPPEFLKGDTVVKSLRAKKIRIWRMMA